MKTLENAAHESSREPCGWNIPAGRDRNSDSGYSGLAPDPAFRARLPLVALVSAIASALALAALTAPLLAPRFPLAALLLRGFFSGVCHQNPARSLVLDGSPAAVCVRCLGIYCGVALGAGLSLWTGRFRRVATGSRCLLLTALLLNAMDVAAESFHLHGNLPLPRFATGVALGIPIGVMFCVRANFRTQVSESRPGAPQSGTQQAVRAPVTPHGRRRGLR